MAKDRGKNEFEMLRTEAESMQREKLSSSPAAAGAATAKESNTLRAETDAGNEDDVGSQLEELVEALEQELKDTSPMTLLIVFALGILIGRLLPK